MRSKVVFIPIAILFVLNMICQDSSGQVNENISEKRWKIRTTKSPILLTTISTETKSKEPMKTNEKKEEEKEEKRKEVEKETETKVEKKEIEGKKKD